ncbi:MAG: tyrosine-type recombinase/integrase [bacterium]|nr:tyrosine-type recombinase/integrase [bacterium]
MPSLRRRKLKSGSSRWVIDYRVEGKAKLLSLGDVDKPTAQRLFHEFCAKQLGTDGGSVVDTAEPASGEHSKNPRGEQQPHRTSKQYRIPDLEREYLQYSKTNKSPNTVEIIQLALWKLREFADDIALADVTFQLIERFKAWRLQQVNGTTTNICLRALKAAFEYAVKIGWLDKNPFRGVKQVHVPEPDYAVYLSEEEVQQLLAAIPDAEFRRLIRFYLLTGCRRTEGASVDWRDIDLEKRTLVIRSTYSKTKKNRVLPIGDNLHDLLVEQGPKKQGKVFPRWRAESVTVMFSRYARVCNFDRKITVHSLRHTTTAGLITAGVDLYTVSRILGHSSTKVTESVYAHVSPAHKLEAMNKLRF